MRWLKWSGIAAAVAVVISCFTTWVVIVSKNIVVTGVDTTGTNFGKPAYFHFIMVFFFLVFSLIQKVWAKRANLLITVLNLAWAMRNYFLIATCSGGECPEKHISFYLLPLLSLLMLVSALFPDIKVEEATKR